jgi:oxygen-independent coproporphyrinogen-3 oxidase
VDIAQLIKYGASVHIKKSSSTAAELPFFCQAPLQVDGLYLHIPFCFHKCHYCDFYSIVDNQDRHEQFVKHLTSELAAISPRLSGPISTIFVGGGTPTLLAAPLWRDLLAALGDNYHFADDLEFTVEANPETVAAELLDTFIAGGDLPAVNRISVGAQSFHPVHLKTLERWHDPVNVGKAVQAARAAGIENINLDLIFAIPGQTLDDWRRDLETALSLHPQHLSCYGLMYEPNTPMTARLKRGEFRPVDEDVEADMYSCTIDTLSSAGFEHYEISNWARPSRRCRHNLLYWHNKNWWPFGPAASGHINGWRWKNAPRLGDYLAGPAIPYIQDVEHVGADTRIGETLMLRLRLIDGIPGDELNSLLIHDDPRRGVIDKYIRSGHLAQDVHSLRFTRKGLYLADTILADLL